MTPHRPSRRTLLRSGLLLGVGGWALAAAPHWAVRRHRLRTVQPSRQRLSHRHHRQHHHLRRRRPARHPAPVHRTGPANQELVDLLAAVAQRYDATSAQIALAWLLAQHPTIVPIPGTTKLHRLRENTAAATVELSPADLTEITAAADKVDLTGDRYPAHMQRWINR